MEARLVIHGWFMEPKTYIEGSLPPKKTEKILNQAFLQLQEIMAVSEPALGTVSLRLKVSSSGKVSDVRYMTNTLLTTQGQVPKVLNKNILALYQSLEFSNARGQTNMTIPLIFG
jgi:hypothetical protein